MVKKPAPKKAPRSKPPPPAHRDSTSTTSAAAATAQDEESSAAGPRLRQADQQRVLTLFGEAFEPVLSSDAFPLLLQEIKQALYNRDFAAAFGKEEYLEAYAARWSPTRALCYAEIFLRLGRYLYELGASGPEPTDRGDGAESPSPVTEPQDKEGSRISESERHRVLRMVSVGGCAAEHVAFAAYLRAAACHGRLTLLDSAPWAQVTDLLQEHVTSPPKLSKYASAAAKSANRPLLEPSALSVNFAQHNVLDLAPLELANALGTGSPLVLTMLFTLNELYTAEGLGKTTKLLKGLGEVMASGSLLLVVDSPGSYSEAAVGQEKKRYPMQWLLHHTLVETEAVGYTWERLESEDSTWFRLSEDLSYPIPLENMRYQLHLYRLQRNE